MLRRPQSQDRPSFSGEAGNDIVYCSIKDVLKSVEYEYLIEEAIRNSKKKKFPSF